jgi:hypothetical protein
MGVGAWLRRRFATELRDTPLTDLAQLGGWKSIQIILTCDQQPDEATMREALKRRKSVGSTELGGSGTDSKRTVSDLRARKTNPA